MAADVKGGVMLISGMATSTLVEFRAISMFSPWPRWGQADGRDGHQPQEGRSLLSRPSQE